MDRETLSSVLREVVEPLVRQAVAEAVRKAVNGNGKAAQLGFLRADEVAERLGVSERSLRRWVRTKGLPAYHLGRELGGGGHLWFRAAEVERWLKQFRTKRDGRGQHSAR